MTKPSAENRVRSRCQARTKLGHPCRATAVENGLCAIHSGRVNAREIGAKGGRARGKAKRGSFRAAVRGLLERDPERYASELLNSGAAGFKLASELLEKEEERAKAEEQAGPIVVDGVPVIGFADLVALAYRTGQAHLLGCPTTLEELEALLATEGQVPEDRRSPMIPERGDASTSASVDEESPLETDALVDPSPASDFDPALRSLATRNLR